ncbi:MAG TPA: prolyl oligopeptidase family serine peptidase, partial [Gemmatimonadales bacterium]
WMRWFGDYDPLATARRVTVPVLILQGALDRQVSAGQADTLAAALRAGGNRDVTEKVYPGLNHLFLPTIGDGSPSEYPTLKDTKLPAQVLDDLAAWLRMKLTVPGH